MKIVVVIVVYNTLSTLSVRHFPGAIGQNIFAINSRHPQFDISDIPVVMSINDTIPIKSNQVESNRINQSFYNNKNDNNNSNLYI